MMYDNSQPNSIPSEHCDGSFNLAVLGLGCLPFRLAGRNSVKASFPPSASTTAPSGSLHRKRVHQQWPPGDIVIFRTVLPSGAVKNMPALQSNRISPMRQRTTSFNRLRAILPAARLGKGRRIDFLVHQLAERIVFPNQLIFSTGGLHRRRQLEFFCLTMARASATSAHRRVAQAPFRQSSASRRGDQVEMHWATSNVISANSSAVGLKLTVVVSARNNGPLF